MPRFPELVICVGNDNSDRTDYFTPSVGKSDKVRQNMTQIASVLAIATVFISLLKLKVQEALREGGGIIMVTYSVTHKMDKNILPLKSFSLQLIIMMSY